MQLFILRILTDKIFLWKTDIILDVQLKLVNIFDGCKTQNKRAYLLKLWSLSDPTKIPTDENEPLKVPDIFNPRYSYGGGKILTELMGANYGKKFFKKLIIFRPHNVYGPDMGNEHVIPEFINRFKKLKGKNFVIQGNGSETRSFIFIDDFVQAFKCILKKGKHLQIYNIGTNEKIKIKKLAEKLSKIFKKKITIKKTSLSKGSTKKRLPDIKKIKSLGFKQKIKLQRGLEILVNNSRDFF